MNNLKICSLHLIQVCSKTGREAANFHRSKGIGSLAPHRYFDSSILFGHWSIFFRFGILPEFRVKHLRQTHSNYSR